MEKGRLVISGASVQLVWCGAISGLKILRRRAPIRVCVEIEGTLIT